MPILAPALLTLGALISLFAGLWMVVHAASVAHAFRHDPAIAPPRRATQSKGRVWAAIALFNAGWIVSAAVWWFLIARVNDPVADDAISAVQV